MSKFAPFFYGVKDNKQLYNDIAYLTIPFKGKIMLVTQERKKICDDVWTDLTAEFDKAKAANPKPQMPRENISFHEDVKLLGYLCQETCNITGDILEIGVWKGKSLALMQRLSSPNTRVIGVDPCELPGQVQDLQYFHAQLFNTAKIVIEYSEKAVPHVTSISKKFKLIHIDGGHNYNNVWLDFLLYERFLVDGGYIVFDDYNDTQYSPEVGVAVNDLHRKGFFDRYIVIGSIPEFKNSFVIKL